MIPMFIIAIPMSIFSYFIARRKGHSPGLFALLGIIPLVNFFTYLYLISLTDKDIMDKINEIYSSIKK